MKGWFMVLCLVALLLAACAPEPIDMPTPAPGPGAACVTIARPYCYIYRCVDKEAEVVCWINCEGTFCLPLDQTALEGIKE